MHGPLGSAGATYDEIAEAFDATRGRPWPFVTGWIEGLGSTDGPVLDVGCGNGRHLKVASGLGLACLGVDLSTALITIARGRLPLEVDLIVGDARALPVPDSKVGALVAVALLHHIQGRHTGGQGTGLGLGPG